VGTKDHDESIRIIHRALDAGVNFVDTAEDEHSGPTSVSPSLQPSARRR
jgi:predicted aldo/keto reductase-like oxidoreductase